MNFWKVTKMDELIPITRIESFLDGIVNGSAVPDPETRIETFLAKIAGENVVTPEPITRIEVFLAKISGVDIPIPQPITRIEMFLAKISGEDIVPPNPITRIEMYLAKWAEGGSDPLNTFTGAIVRFLAKRAKPIVKIEANFTPIQSLNGQEAPWPPGGGKNKTPTDVVHLTTNTYTEITVDDDGTESRDWVLSWEFSNADVTTASASLFTFYDGATGTAKVPTSCQRVSDNVYWSNVTKPATGRFYVKYTGKLSSIRCFYESASYGKWSGNDITNIMLEVGTTPSTFAPYSNICPISGHTGCDIFDKAEYDAQATPTATINFGQTVYSGTLTVNEDGSGSIKARPYYASYNGETLVGPWVSSMDAYALGATPTTGAQVVDMGGTETTIPLTASQINTLVGTNTVWVDSATGDITVQAYGTAIT